MTHDDPNARIYFAHKHFREVDGKFYYFHASPSEWWVKLHGLPELIVKVSVRERLPADPESAYFGWLASDNPSEYTLVWPSEGQFNMCWPYGFEAEEKRGRGRRVNLIVEELP